jgi:hypothetical protein
MAPTHTIGGVNWAHAWHTTLTLLGAGLILAGIGLGAYREFAPARKEAHARA